MLKKTIVVLAGALISASSFAAMTELSTPSNGTPCNADIQARIMDMAKSNFERDKKNLIAANDAKKSIKPQTGLSCLDNLGLAASMGFPSWSRILSSITNQVKNKACTQITQGISSVSGAINQSIGFKGIPGVDGQIIDGSGISINGGVNQSGNTGIYTNGSLSTPGYTTSPTPFQKVAPDVAPQKANEPGLMDKLSRAIKSAF